LNFLTNQSKKKKKKKKKKRGEKNEIGQNCRPQSKNQWDGQGEKAKEKINIQQE
jgi:hypothetical protein